MTHTDLHTAHTLLEAQRVVRKLYAAGWHKRQLQRMFHTNGYRVDQILNEQTIHWVADVSLETVLSYTFLPELRDVELHMVSQVSALGYTHGQLAKLTGSKSAVLCGIDRREAPDYRALGILFRLAAGRAEPMHPNPNCAVENCRARGEWLSIAQSTFCTVHAARAARILGTSHNMKEAA